MKVSLPIVIRNSLVRTVNLTYMNSYVLCTSFKGSQSSHCGSFHCVVTEGEVSRVNLEVFGHIYRAQ